MVYDIMILVDKQLCWVTAALKSMNKFIPCISVSSCGSHYLLYSFLLLPCRVIWQVFLTGISRVERDIYEKLKFHYRFGDILFPLAALKLCQGELNIVHLQQSEIERRDRFSDTHFCSPCPLLVSSVQDAAQVALHYGWLCAPISQLAPWQSHLCFSSVYKSQSHKMVRPQ